jgi:hypothetical protein
LHWSYTSTVTAAHPWPDIPDEHRWSIELMEELLADTEQTPEELGDRARQLRGQAEASEFEGQRDAYLALADRYEQAATRRLAGARS